MIIVICFLHTSSFAFPFAPSSPLSLHTCCIHLFDFLLLYNILIFLFCLFCFSSVSLSCLGLLPRPRHLVLPSVRLSLLFTCLPSFSRSEEANKAFSAAVQMHDVLVKAWAMWGDYLENIFVKDRQLHLGVSAITCYLHACRHQNESKSRKYLAKVIREDVLNSE